MKRNQILRQLVWTGVVYGILFMLLTVLLIQKFEVSQHVQLFGANEVQPQIFLN